MRKTKIVCTLGPATDSYAMIKKLIKAGMNVARINMSHGSHEEHKARIDLVKRARAELNTPVAILMDTKGPEIRVKTFENGCAELIEGDYFTLTTADTVGNNARVSVTYADLPSAVKEGDHILLNDGLIELKVASVTGKEVVCTVVTGGILSDRKSINLPGISIDMPYLSDADRADIAFGIEQDVDYFALSFVRSVDDIRQVKQILNRRNACNIQIIANNTLNNYEEVKKITTGSSTTTEQQNTAIQNMAWQSFVDQILFIENARDAGIIVGEDELVDLTTGSMVSPLIKNNPVFLDENGNFSAANVVEFVQAVGQDQSGNLKLYWDYLQNTIFDQQYYTKYY